METFSVLLRVAVTAESVVEFVKANTGGIIDKRSGYGSIERGLACIYIGLEEPTSRDSDSIEYKYEQQKVRVQSVLLVTVSRHDGSKYLAFEIASNAAERWDGVIN